MAPPWKRQTATRSAGGCEVSTGCTVSSCWRARTPRSAHRLTVRDELKQPAGLVHGGVYASMAEAMASLATALGVAESGNTAMGLSNMTSFLRPITAGTVHARATRIHRGRSTWVWDVRFSDDVDHTCAVTRMTIAVRPAPDATVLTRAPAKPAGAVAAAAARAAAFRRSRCSAARGVAARRASRLR